METYPQPPFFPPPVDQEPTTSTGIRKRSSLKKVRRPTENIPESELISIEFEHYPSFQSNRLPSTGSKVVSFDSGEYDDIRIRLSKSSLTKISGSKSFNRCDKCNKTHSKSDMCEDKISRKDSSGSRKSPRLSKHSSAVLRDALLTLSRSDEHCHRYSHLSFYNQTRDGRLTPKTSKGSMTPKSSKSSMKKRKSSDRTRELEESGRNMDGSERILEEGNNPEGIGMILSRSINNLEESRRTSEGSQRNWEGGGRILSISGTNWGEEGSGRNLLGMVSGSAVLNDRIIEEVYVQTSGNLKTSLSDINIPNRFTSELAHSLPDLKRIEILEERPSLYLKGLLTNTGYYQLSYSKSETFAHMKPASLEEPPKFIKIQYAQKLEIVTFNLPRTNLTFWNPEYQYQVEILTEDYLQIFRGIGPSTSKMEPVIDIQKPFTEKEEKTVATEPEKPETEEETPAVKIKSKESFWQSSKQEILKEITAVRVKPASLEPPISIDVHTSSESATQRQQKIELKAKKRGSPCRRIFRRKKSSAVQKVSEITVTQPETEREVAISQPEESHPVKPEAVVDQIPRDSSEKEPKHKLTVRIFGGRRKASKNSDQAQSTSTDSGPNTTYTVQHCTVKLSNTRSMLIPFEPFPAKKFKPTEEKNPIQEGGQDKLIQRKFLDEDPWPYDIKYTIQKSRPETCPTFHSQRTKVQQIFWSDGKKKTEIKKLKRKPLKKRRRKIYPDVSHTNLNISRQVKILEIHPVSYVSAVILNTPNLASLPAPIPKKYFSVKIGFSMILGRIQHLKFIFHNERSVGSYQILQIPLSAPLTVTTTPAEPSCSSLKILSRLEVSKISPNTSTEMKILWESLLTSQGDSRQSQAAVRMPSWVPLDHSPQRKFKKNPKREEKNLPQNKPPEERKTDVENSVTPVLHKVNKFMVVPKVNLFEGFNYPVIFNARTVVPFSHDDIIIIKGDENETKNQVVMLRKYK